MSGGAAFAREIDALEALRIEIAKIGERQDDRRRHDLVQLRRELSAQIARVGEVAEPIFEAAAKGQHMQDYRARFSRMRSMTAIHQAQWPAVRLVPETEDEYLASALQAHVAIRDFVSWARGAIVSLR